MRNKFLLTIWILFLFLSFWGNAWPQPVPSPPCWENATPLEGVSTEESYTESSEEYPAMRVDINTLLKWIREVEEAPRAYIDENIDRELMKLQFQGYGSSFSLLNQLPYTPSARNQGSCSNCWVWAGTGVMEIAHSVRNGVKDRLSIQFLNSCKTDEFSCCAGTLQKFSDWYGLQGFSVPSSNTYANYQDGTTRCESGHSSRSCATISTDPYYRITSITPTTIPAIGLEQSIAISNIKNVLNQKKAIFLGIRWPDSSAWNGFVWGWKNLGETAIYNPDSNCGIGWNQGVGHALLVVGYNDADSDPSKHYWTVVNSWGTAGGLRPNGIFRLKMYINYQCSYYGTIPALEWQTLDIKMPTLRITSPNGGETWEIGTTKTITWTSSDLNQAGNLYIYYWYNDGWQQIAGPLSASTTSYLWDIPNTPTSSTGIRIGNWLDNDWETLDESDKTFTLETVSAPSIPVGPANGVVGTSYTYSTKGSSSSGGHSIQYLFDWGNGTNSGWLPVGKTSASKSWTAAGTYVVKAQARCAAHTSVVSDWSAELPVGIEVVSVPTAPSGPAIGIPGTSYSYSVGGASSNLGHPLQYFFNWGDGTNSGWLPVGQTSASKSWSSVGTFLVKCRARCSADNSVISPWSETLLVAIERVSTPASPSGPNGGNPGTGYTYSTGRSSSNLGHSIQYLFDWGDGTNSGWLPTGTMSAYHSWTSTGTNLVKAQARCATHTSVVSSWSGNLSVIIETVSSPATPYGDVTSGTVGASYVYTTSGSSSNLGHSIQYLFDWEDGTNSGWLPTGKTSASKSWSLPGSFSVRAKARCSTHNLVISDWSSALQVSMQKLTVITPNGGEVIPSGIPYTIQWTAPFQAEKFKIFYSMDNGATWILITSDATGTSHSWTVPVPPSNKNTCLVKVVGHSASNVKVGEDKSDKPFTIDVVRLVSPNGGEVLKTGDPYTIQWEINGTKSDVTKVNLYYTTNGGASYTLINSTPLDGASRTYDWPVPTPTANMGKCYVKVVAYSGNTVLGTDTSDKPFMIEGVKLTQPNGGEVLKTGDPYTIQWEINGTKSDVTTQKLYYSMDGGATWSLIATLDSASRSYDWTVPVLTCNKNRCYVKVVAYSSSTVVGSDRSAKPFTIAVVELLYPNGGGVYQSGSSYRIGWNIWTKSPVATARLYYSVDGGASWSLIATLDGSFGYYEWIPLVQTTKTKCKIKVAISDTGITAADMSDGYFTIQP